MVGAFRLLGISAGGVRACVCRLRKRGVLPPPARQYAPSSRPRAGAQKEAIRAAVLADPDISSAALAARLGTSPDTVRSCISLLRRSGALPPAPRRRAEPAPPAEPQPREPQLQERIQAAVLAEPRVTSTTLAARFNTSPASVRSAVGTLRQRGLLPPAPERPLVEPDTMRGRLLQLITEQPGISAVGAAPALGVGIMAIHDASHALRKKGLILPNDPALPGLYPLSSKGAAMPAEKKPADTDARLQEVLAVVQEKAVSLEHLPEFVTFFFTDAFKKDENALANLTKKGGDPQARLAEMPQLRFVPVVSDALPEDQWQGRTGFVHKAVLQDFADLSGHQVYACGAPIVIDSAKADYTALAGLPEDEFFADSFTTEADKAKDLQTS